MNNYYVQLYDYGGGVVMRWGGGEGELVVGGLSLSLPAQYIIRLMEDRQPTQFWTKYCGSWLINYVNNLNLKPICTQKKDVLVQSISSGQQWVIIFHQII